MAPTFSVIVPTHDRPEELSQCLAALSELDYPREQFETIVVNDGGCSIDAAVAPFLDRMNLTHVTEKHCGPGAARNAGVRLACGRYVAFTDGDCLPERAWLAELERHLAADDTVMVGGKTINMLDDNVYSAASQLLVAYLYEYYNPNQARARFFTSNNMAMSRAAFLNMGGFDSQYPRPAAEDRELCDRWTQSGRRMAYAEAALIRHSHRLALRSFWRQHFQYGQGALRYRRGRAQRDASPLQFEPLSFYTGLLRYPLRHSPQNSGTSGMRKPYRIAALLFIAQIATTMGFFWAKLFEVSPPSAFAMKAPVKPPC